MQSLPKAYHFVLSIFLREIPHVVGFSAVCVIFLSSLIFLALPAKASLTSEQVEQKLNEPIYLNFKFPIKRASVKVEVFPPVEFDHSWSGLLVNQNLIIKPKNLLQPNQTYQVVVKDSKNPIGLSAKSSSFSFKTESLPKIVGSYPKPDEGRIKSNPIFSFTLDKKVDYGDFELISNPPIEVEQKRLGEKVEFIPKANLFQGKKYFIALSFKAAGIDVTNLFAGEYLVVEPLKIVKTSPKQKVTNASKKSVVSIKFNKEVKTVFLGSFIKLNPSQEGSLEFVNKKEVKFTPNPQFLTDTEYKITVDKNLEAEDGGMLEEDFVLKFEIAGPVQVVGATPQGWGIPLISPVSVTFDQVVDKKSAQAKFSVQPKVAGTFSWSGNTMTFVPKRVLNLFKNYGFSLSIGVKGNGGEPSNKVFNFNFRTTLERSRTIGYSIQGRPIKAYYFGVGSKKILLVGAMHGSEANSGNLLTSWVAYLRANQNSIAEGRTFIVVPLANPDGVAKENRFNARGVDLNRNWNTPTWQKTTYWNGGPVTNGGGAKPFSEPETKALRDLINTENPKITLSYHSAAGVVISDGVSNSLRDWYSSKTGYTALLGAAQYDEVFSYDVTGSLEEWLGEKNKIVVVVELASPYSSEYLRNLPALKGLLNYPL
ncbi:MAG: Ig-like domain-containing protein [Candidatus Woykebacteria bacterium]